MTKKIFLFLMITLLTTVSGKAQKGILFFDFTGGGGRLFPTPRMKHLAGPVTLFNARLGLKTLGKKEWQRVYNYPQIGLGISHNYLSTKSLGSPTAIYSFLNLPLFTKFKTKFNLGMHIGVAWGFNPNPEKYPLDIVIGSKIAAYGMVDINTSVHLTNRLEVLFSAEAYHLSNGNTNKPNKGINMLGAETGIRYFLSNPTSLPNGNFQPKKKKESSIIVFGAVGWVDESTKFSINKPTGSLSTGYYKTINQKSRLSTGIDLFYDEGVLLFTLKNNQLQNVMAAGIFGGHELTLGQISIVTQAGIYIHNPYPSDPFYYERFGIRYSVSKYVIPSIAIKVHGGDVDFIEWGIGFVLWRKHD